MDFSRKAPGRLKPLSHQSEEGATDGRIQLVLSPDQQVAYDAILAWIRSHDTRYSLGGFAGTGKSSIIGILGQQLIQDKKRIAYCTYTGKASLVLRAKLRDQGIHPSYCGTIHRLIYTPVTDEDGDLEWALVAELPYDLIVLDEASMVGRELYEDLASFGLPILAVGDHGQLPPVGSETYSLVENPDVRLETIHRQAEGNPIIALSKHIRETGTHRGFKPKDDRVRFVKSLIPEIESTMSADDCFDAAVLTYTNASRIGFNQRIRKLRGFIGKPKAGDIIICLKNAYLGTGMIANGSRGILMTCTNGEEEPTLNATVLFPDDDCTFEGPLNAAQFERKDVYTVDTLREEWSNRKVRKVEDAGLLFDFGFSLTCHKSQGSQFDTVLVDSYVPHFIDDDTTRRWLYTSCTRAVSRLIMTK